jgi:hypothetical protein
VVYICRFTKIWTNKLGERFGRALIEWSLGVLYRILSNESDIYHLLIE